MKSTEINSPTSCLSKCYNNEPIFILRAQDRIAPFIVRIWATMAAFAGVSLEKTSEAHLLASEMEHWQSQNTSKIPD